ncbi:MAG: tRNA preQ1(34) S-adenosylmethionine ribosyltransferase-isomerase QueA [Candidatus Omnitrophica bacterium]|nr:tRNA preQ1(34) S-adenosylmethionine ribosyltransferase-isomerase QueA [Candidatus Omnitrophota bacterium]
MRLSEFDYKLPEELIAQYPAQAREASRLMVVHKISKKIEHRNFRDIVDYIGPQDCLVVNDTKVIKARLPAKRADTGAKAEITLIEKMSERLYKCLIDTSTKIKVGTKFTFGAAELTGVIRGESEGIRLIEFSINGADFGAILDKIGIVPLPPYIKRLPEKSDEERYQTVYARTPGAVAAPTAGLHFTDETLDKIKARGAQVESVTLHVGYGTFKPVSVDEVSRHKLEPEVFEFKEEAALRLNDVKEKGGKIFAVGTTTCRVLENQAQLVKGSKNRVEKGKGWTNLFIYPPYNFKFVDALVTNFHLPKTTLLMLVAAFCGREVLSRAYDEAVKEKYRFYSYGDSMLII